MTLAAARDLSLIILVLEAMLFVAPVLVLLYFGVSRMRKYRIAEKLLRFLERVREYTLLVERETKRGTNIIVMPPIMIASAIIQVKHTSKKLIPNAARRAVVQTISKQGDTAA